MTTEVNIDGLLHLSAITVAISAVYIGLDRIRRERDQFRVELKRVQERVQKALRRLDVKIAGK